MNGRCRCTAVCLPGFALLCLLSATACRHRGGDPVTMADLKAEREPVEEIHGALIQTSEAGRPRLRIEAATMRTYEDPDSSFVVLDGDTARGRVVVRLFDAAGQPSAVIQANRVIRHEDEGRFEARGNVEVVNVEGSRLESEELRWQEDERVVRSSGFVRIDTPTEQLEGYALEAAEDLTWYRLERVTGRVTVTEE